MLRMLSAAPGGRVVRVFRRLVVVGSVGYLAAVLILGYGQLQAVQWGGYVQACLLSLALYPISVGAQAIAWSLGLGFLRHQSLHVASWDVQIFASSHLLKRLPGGAWYIAGRVSAYQDQGVPAKGTVVRSEERRVGKEWSG